MTVEIVKRMKVKKIDLDKADVVKREVNNGLVTTPNINSFNNITDT